MPDEEARCLFVGGFEGQKVVEGEKAKLKRNSTGLEIEIGSRGKCRVVSCRRGEEGWCWRGGEFPLPLPSRLPHLASPATAHRPLANQWPPLGSSSLALL